jgi:hypothetical protein
MSTLYNRRRGAGARKIRTPRVCRHGEGVARDQWDPGDGLDVNRCIQLALRNRYCDEHQRPPTAIPAGVFQPMARSGGHPTQPHTSTRSRLLARAKKRWRRAVRQAQR